jgi:hypothetical protein
MRQAIAAPFLPSPRINNLQIGGAGSCANARLSCVRMHVDSCSDGVRRHRAVRRILGLSSFTQRRKVRQGFGVVLCYGVFWRIRYRSVSWVTEFPNEQQAPARDGERMSHHGGAKCSPFGDRQLYKTRPPWWLRRTASSEMSCTKDELRRK